MVSAESRLLYARSGEDAARLEQLKRQDEMGGGRMAEGYGNEQWEMSTANRGTEMGVTDMMNAARLAVMGCGTDGRSSN